MNIRFSTFTTLGLIALTAASLRAQPASATFRPALVDEFSTSFTMSGEGDLRRGSTKVGELSLQRFDLSLAGKIPVRQGLIFTPGLAYTHTRLDFSPALALPKTLQEFSVNLGVRGIFNREWAYLAALRPGFYGDAQLFRGGTFNAPFFFAAFYQQNPNLTWTVGVMANAFNDHPVLPAVGLRWKFTPEWQLDVGFPRTGVTYTFDSQLSFRAGLSVLGGNYRITENLGVPAPGIARINRTYLDITEVRVGVGATYQLAANLDLEFDLGATTLRRFDYPDRNYRLNGANVGWFTVGLRSRF